jgi:N-acetylglucosaminyl-diphospho-decaprenol L-rhamnosyltransferase
MAKNEESDLTIAVVTWNSSAVIGGLLASLDEGLAGLSWRLVVTDNDSADHEATAAAVAAVPGARFVRMGRNAGYAAGINAALAAAPPRTAALVLNPDIRLAPGCVPRMLAHLGSGAGIVVPTLRDGDGTLAHSLRREPSLPRAFGEAVLGRRAGRYPRWGETVVDESCYTAPAVVDWATGAIMLISAECLAACGPWDESFFLYSEETEFALRARDRGFSTLFAPDADAVHIGGESRVSPRLWALLTTNRVRLYRRRHGPVAGAAYWSVVLLRETTRAALGQPRARRAVRALLSF